jgi:CRISPR-associated protein Cmr1
MHRTRYTLETITPLFLRGPDGETPELRTPSFKGMLRYWWRALHPQPVDQLRQRESQRFGSAGDQDGGRSPVRLRIPHQRLSTGHYKPVPRPSKGFRNEGFDPGQTFDLIVTVGHRAQDFAEEIDATIRLMILLGGLGNRSRRGFGSLRLVAVDSAPHDTPEDPLEGVETQLRRLSFSYNREGRTIHYDGRHSAQDGPGYPWVQRVETGQFQNGWQDAVQSIAEVAHKEDSSYSGDINPRLSSPLYVSVGADNRWCWPVLTGLNLPASSERKISQHESDRRPDFRDALL